MKHCPTKDPSPDSWKDAVIYASIVVASVISGLVIICHVAKKSIHLITPL